MIFSKAKLLVLTTAAVAALSVAATANAHVNVHPNSLPANRFMSIFVRVPNERPNASTIKVDLLVPTGVTYLYTSPVAGWKITRPAPYRVLWTAVPGGGVKPDQFVEFPIAFATPDQTGAKLTFKALQYYSNGEVVRWIGAPGSDNPGSVVTIADHNAAVTEYPAGISGSVQMKVIGAAIGLGPVLLLVGYALGRRRRRDGLELP